MSKENFLNQMIKENNYAYTENGAITNKSSLNALLDFFGQAGAMRNRYAEDIINLFVLAFKEDALRSIKCVFYLGDILEGQGERSTFRILLRYIARNYPQALKENIHLIPKFNRWDSIYTLFDTPLEGDVATLLAKQLSKDLNSETPSLCAKWLKSTNTSSKETRELGRKTARLLNLSEKQYRKMLVKLRAKIKVVETLMSAKKWNDINYSNVPSKAMNNYNRAFYKHDSERFESYVDDLAIDTSKINSKTLYPYEIVKKILNYRTNSIIDKKITEAQWKALPDFIVNKNMKGICVVDVSGSMNGTPLEVAISTGLYVSEKCIGTYHNKFITFSSQPKLVTVKGDTLHERVNYVRNADWGMNTDLEAVFDLILDTAIRNNSSQTDMPDYLIIITDMEFDAIQHGNRKKTLIETLSERYETAGYKLPILVFWNVNANGRNMPMTVDECGWISVSGYSPSIFKAILSEELLGAENIEKEKIDPVETMLVVLDSERYAEITI